MIFSLIMLVVGLIGVIFSIIFVRNVKLAKIDRWKDTIYTYYKGFDTTPLDLNKFVKI